MWYYYNWKYWKQNRINVLVFSNLWTMNSMDNLWSNNKVTMLGNSGIIWFKILSKMSSKYYKILFLKSVFFFSKYCFSKLSLLQVIPHIVRWSITKFWLFLWVCWDLSWKQMQSSKHFPLDNLWKYIVLSCKLLFFCVGESNHNFSWLEN